MTLEFSPVLSERKELTLFNRILMEEIWNYPEESIKSGGYVLDSLEACFWCVMNSLIAVAGGLVCIYRILQSQSSSMTS
jgi:ADP-ribosylglycohydrolase